MLILDMIYPVYSAPAPKLYHNRIIKDFQGHVTDVRIFYFFRGIPFFKFAGPQLLSFGK